MKKMFALMSALALAAVAQGSTWLMWNLYQEDGSSWSGGTAYLFVAEDQTTLDDSIARWFADGILSADELAQIKTSKQCVASSTLNEYGDTWYDGDVDLPFTVEVEGYGWVSKQVAAVAVLVSSDGSSASYVNSSSAWYDGWAYEDGYSDSNANIYFELYGDNATTLTANTVSVSSASKIVKSIKATKVRQHYPWNGLIDIELSAASNVVLNLSAKNPATGEELPVETLTMNGETFKPGITLLTNSTVKLLWDSAADLPSGTVITNAKFYASIEGMEEYIPVDYMVIDVSGGTEATEYPVTYLYSVPSGGWTDEYKTTKIVMRRIPAGTFKMGSPEVELGRESDETQHKVTLTSDFWIGVFEVTQAQYTNLVAFANTPYYSGEMRPAEAVTYNTLVGTESPISNLVAKTGLAFTLPTEAQWEYACRAGTKTALNNGTDLESIGTDSNLSLLGRYLYNGGETGQHAVVGSYLPNNWGLYDMHGNVFEWCLDWYGTYDSDAVTDPTGPESGSSRVLRGGAHCNEAYWCRSARRHKTVTAGVYSDIGFRLACPAQ